MRSSRWIGWIGLLAIVVAAQQVSAAVTDEQVRGKIKQIVDLLYKAQNDRGTWDPAEPTPEADGKPNHVTGTNYGGVTALVTYALLTAGESYQNPKLKRAIEFLSNLEVKGTYAAGLSNHVWSHLPPKFEPQTKKTTDWLIKAQGGGPKHGGYTYVSLNGLINPSPTAPGGPFDNSNTQYGVLGVWEGAKRGMGVPQSYWEKVEAHFLAMQGKDGGWSYVTPDTKFGDVELGTYGSMTASGLTCLFITQDYLHNDDFRKPGAAARHPLTLNIQKGLDWFDKNFKANENPAVGGKGLGNTHYYLMGVERIGLASGYKRFGSHDWYAEGAEYLTRAPGADPINLSFSLIFLVRGRVPVFANKLRIDDYDWNNRPRDLSRVAGWLSDEVEQEVIWQIVGLGDKPEEWLDAPILYIAGHQALKLDEGQAAKIKRFIDLGGLVVTAADNAEAAFTHSVQQLYEKLYPKLKLAKIGAKDEVMDVVFTLKANTLGALSLSNGVRHLAIHIPRDVSWQFHSSAHADPFPWQFMANVYSYATEKGQARPRLSEHFVARTGAGGGPKVEVARVKYEGDWDPEPAAWEVQGNWMSRESKAEVSTKVIAMEELDKAGVKFAHLAGVGPVKFSQAQIDALKKFVSAGGVVLLENVGGRGGFTDSLGPVLAQALPESRIKPLGVQAEPVSGKGFNGFDVGRVSYRAYTVLKSGRVTIPRLQVITVGDRPAIFISGEDLSTGMLGKPGWGIYGYDATSARKIVSNLVMWAQAKSAGGRPAR